LTTLSIKLSNPSFTNNSFIPSKFSCDGENINPQLDIDHLPEGTKSLALIIEVKVFGPAFFICIDLAVTNDKKVGMHNKEVYLEQPMPGSMNERV